MTEALPIRRGFRRSLGSSGCFSWYWDTHPLDSVGDLEFGELPFKLVRWPVLQHGENDQASLHRLDRAIETMGGFPRSVSPFDGIDFCADPALGETAPPQLARELLNRVHADQRIRSAEERVHGRAPMRQRSAGPVNCRGAL
jgi:hypothetical protein